MKFAVMIVFCLTWQRPVSSTVQLPISINTLPSTASSCSTPPCLNTGGVINGPINLDTAYATELKTATPLTYTFLDSEKYKIINTGNAIEVILNQPTTMNSVTGGVLGDKRYKFHKIRYYWDQDYDGDASYKLDSSVTALNGEFVYYNEEYGSIENSCNKPHAVAVTRIQLSVEGTIPNLKFAIFENILRGLTKPGSYHCISGCVRDTLYAFFDRQSIPYPFYYSYKATYYDPEQNSTVGYDATYIAIPKSLSGYISVCQFTAFTSIQTFGGRPMAPVESAYPSIGQVVHQTSRLVEKICYTPYNCTSFG